MAKYDQLIAKLYPDPVDAAFAKSLIARFENDPRMDGGRLEAMLHEGARVNQLATGGQMAPAEARELLSGFAQSIGVAPDLMSALSTWYDSVADEVAAVAPAAAETESAAKPTPHAGGAAAAGAPAGQPAPPSVTAAPAWPALTPGANLPNVNDRISEIETKHMRAAPGTPEYAAYWLGESGQQMQQEYRELVTARDTMREPQATAPPPLAGGAAAPGQAGNEQ